MFRPDARDVMIEREIKLPFDSALAARAAILATGATPLRTRRLQDDYLLDSFDGLLRRRGCALRVRRESGQSRLTFKGPVQPSVVKLREELETLVTDGGLLLQILEQVGFQVWFRYQKYREEFTLLTVILAVDETPVGTFVEIEGDEGGITAAAAALGRRPEEYLRESYRSLFVRACQMRGVPATDMLFDSE
jgi:adenylate cyclase class 2